MGTAETATLAALRNFFLARTGEGLAAACVPLAHGDEMAPNITEMGITDWEEAEFVFNRLFVGPMALEAPPYASYYLEPEPQLMGASTLRVQRLYKMAGLVSPLQGSLPDDHLGVELDAALGLLAITQQSDAEEPHALWEYFLHEHLKAWLPKFFDRARGADSGHPVVDLALNRLEAWLKDQETKQEGYDQ